MGAPASVRKNVPASSSVSITNLPANSTIHIQPGGGGAAQMTCQVRIHPADALIDVDSTTAIYAAAATRVILGPVAELVAAAIGADGAISVAY